jgi:hypothetical protein
LESRLGNHPAGPTGARRQKLKMPDAQDGGAQAQLCEHCSINIQVLANRTR